MTANGPSYERRDLNHHQICQCPRCSGGGGQPFKFAIECREQVVGSFVNCIGEARISENTIVINLAPIRAEAGCYL
jgi:hypothetical protein